MIERGVDWHRQLEVVEHQSFGSTTGPGPMNVAPPRRLTGVNTIEERT
jgi:hypothetical protein